MIIRSYSGRTIAEALTKVRTDLGEQALIIETRSIKAPGLLGGTIGYEVVAAQERGTSQRGVAPTAHVRMAQAYAPSAPEVDDDQDNVLSAPLPQRRAAPAQPALAATATATRTPVADIVTPSPAPAGEGHLSRELAAIRNELHRLAAGQRLATHHLGDLSDELAASEMPSEICAEIDQMISAAGDRLNASRHRDFITAWLRRSLPCQTGIDWSHTRHVMVVGATGVGKTTSIAKLAAQLVHEHKKKIGIITIDTYRIGAQDQLRAYADLLDVPLAVASTPAQFTRALADFATCDHILIDTAGRSPADAARVHELRSFCKAAASDGKELALMLAISATSGRAEFAAVVERFSVLPLTHTLITKLDECAAIGRLYGCLRRHRLEPSYFTTGQEVPDDITTGNAQVLIDRLWQPALSAA